MKKLPAALALVAALALTGCTAGAGDAPAAASATPAAAEQAADTTQAWADKMINQWLGANGARSIDALTGPAHFVDSWESPARGTLIVHTRGGAYTDDALAMVASSILHGTGQDLQKITAVNEYGTYEATYERP